MKNKLILPILMGVLSLSGLSSCGEHVHKFDQQKAESTYLVSAADCTSKAVYNYSCKCGEKGDETFEHGNSLGHDYSSSQYEHNETQHWQICARSGCNQESSKTNHSGGEATETELAVCEVCQTPYGDYAEHQHSPSSSHYEVKENVLYLVEECACEDKSYKTVDVTKPVEVSSAQDLVTVINAGCSVKLMANIELEEMLTIDGIEITLDLNGHSITGVWTDDSKGACLIHVINQARVTIDGNGSLLSGTGSYVNTLLCAIGANIVINSGSFVVAEGNALLYAQKNDAGTVNSTITINDGYFEAHEDYNGIYFTLNLDEQDSSDQSTFYVNGGRFYKFNPSASKADGGSVNFVNNEVYHVEEETVEGATYYVVKAHTRKDSAHDSSTHWISCSSCDHKFDEASHNLVAGHDETKHYQSCECGYVANEEVHQFVTKYDENKHYQECSCGYIKDEQAHSLVAGYDATHHYQSCECGYVVNKVTHNLVTIKNETHHHDECECGYKTEDAAHEYVISYDYNIKKSTCSCGESISEELAVFNFWTDHYSNSDNGKVYIYYWNANGDAWAECKLVTDNGDFGDYYELTIEGLQVSDIDGFLIFRGTAANWDNKYQQSGNKLYSEHLATWKQDGKVTYYL